MSLFFDDLKVGAETVLGERAFTREAIIAFAILYDPQPFHLSDEAGRASIYGSLIASGWHTASVCMRLIVEHRERERAAATARGETLPKIGVSPGVRDLRWPVAVRPGDRIVYWSRIESLTQTKRPQWGLATSRTWGVNQDGAEVFSMTGGVLWEKRPG
ncbi:MAG TPA: MaoC/PaaZ C-terminal domain-containing protein [Roseiarcus sp.]|nr:MaoC/PaaZ C-terminal domain-containing protein [Roseiarcus sp.]